MLASGVCEDRTREPGLVGGEQPGGAVFEPVVFPPATPGWIAHLHSHAWRILSV